MILSILIPTLPHRQKYLARLLEAFSHETPGHEDEVEILIDDSSLPLGTKENALLARAQGQYVVVFDDDDLPSWGYVFAILMAALEDPDVIGYWVQYYEDGKAQELGWHTTRNNRYGQQTDCNGRMMYLRPITPKNVVRTSLAREVGFPDVEVYNGEDIDFATRLAPKIRSEVFIDGRVLYHYFFRNNKATEPVEEMIDPPVCESPAGKNGRITTVYF